MAKGQLSGGWRAGVERAGRQSLSVQAEMFACVQESPWRAGEAEAGKGDSGPGTRAPSRCCTTRDSRSVSSLHSLRLCMLL